MGLTWPECYPRFGNRAVHFAFIVLINAIVVSPILQMRQVERRDFVTVPRLHSAHG